MKEGGYIPSTTVLAVSTMTSLAAAAFSATVSITVPATFFAPSADALA